MKPKSGVGNEEKKGGWKVQNASYKRWDAGVGFSVGLSRRRKKNPPKERSKRGVDSKTITDNPFSWFYI